MSSREKQALHKPFWRGTVLLADQQNQKIEVWTQCLELFRVFQSSFSFWQELDCFEHSDCDGWHTMCSQNWKELKQWVSIEKKLCFCNCLQQKDCLPAVGAAAKNIRRKQNWKLLGNFAVMFVASTLDAQRWLTDFAPSQSSPKSHMLSLCFSCSTQPWKSIAKTPELVKIVNIHLFAEWTKHNVPKIW